MKYAIKWNGILQKKRFVTQEKAIEAAKEIVNDGRDRIVVVGVN